MTIDQVIEKYHLNSNNSQYIRELLEFMESGHPFEFMRLKSQQLGYMKMSASNLTKLYWQCRGYSENESISKIAEIQGFRTSIKKRIDKLVSEGYSKEEASLKMKEWSEFKSKSVSDSHKRAQEKDPTYLKSMSHHCPEFWMKKGFSEEAAKIEAARACENNRKKFREKLDSGEIKKGWNNTTIEYYLKQNLTIDEAKLALIDRQKTFTLEKCIQKYGEDLGREKWKNRQEKWFSSYRKKSYSFISQDLFWKIQEQMCFHSNDIAFATFENGIKTETINLNKEARLYLDTRVVLPDFIHLPSKKIIEFDGVYYHKNTPENKAREFQRDQDLSRNGYTVLHVNEKEYKLFPEETINKCKEFLKS